MGCESCSKIRMIHSSISNSRAPELQNRAFDCEYSE
jgi:hypothetical protein